MHVLVYCILIALLIALIKVYQGHGIVYPGTWFSLAWLSAFIAYDISIWLEVPIIGVIYDRANLQLLEFSVILTGMSFIIMICFARRPTAMQTRVNSLNLSGYSDLLLRVFTMAAFIAAMGNWFAYGADISSMEFRRGINLQSLPDITAKIRWIYMLAYPSAFIIGWKYCKKIIFKEHIRLSEYCWYSIPLISGIFWSISTGGRQASGIVFLYYLVGFSLSTFTHHSKKSKLEQMALFKKGMLPIIAIIIVFAAFVTSTGVLRERFKTGSIETQAVGFHQYAVLAPFAQFVEYMGISIPAFQLHCNIESAGKRNFGRETFGVLRFIYLEPILGWDRIRGVDVLSANEELAAQGHLLANSTNTVYFDLITDFHLTGTWVCCVLFPVISHWIFLRWSKRKNDRYMHTHIPLAITIMFWCYSHQYSMLREDVLVWMLLSFWAWDISSALLRNMKGSMYQNVSSS